jgi:arylsulfatase A-like enzyme
VPGAVDDDRRAPHRGQAPGRHAARHKIDGRDIWPLIAGEAGARSPHEAYYFYYGRELQAVRSGKWKLHFPHGYSTLNGRKGGTAGMPAKYDQARIELSLYDLEQDPGEKNDVKDANSEVVARLQALGAAMRKDLGDALTKEPGPGAREPGRVKD